MGINAPTGVAEISPPPAGDQATNLVSGQFTAVGPGKVLQATGQINAFLYASINTTLTTTAGSSTATVGSGTGIAAGQAINSVNVPLGTTWGAFSGTSGTLAFPSLTLRGNLLSNGQIVNLDTTAGLLGASVSGPNIPAGSVVMSIVQAAIQQPSGSNAANVLGVVQISGIIAATSPNNDRQAFVFGLTSQAVTTGADTAATFTGGTMAFAGTVQIERCFDGGKTWIPCNAGTGTIASFVNSNPISTAIGEPERGMLYRVNCLAFTSGVINYRLSESGQAASSLAVSSPI